MRVAHSRELVAQGRPAAVVARVAGISRQAIYRRPARPPKGQRRALSDIDRVVLDVARENPTDGTRMVAALASHRLNGDAVNRKRVQRLSASTGSCSPSAPRAGASDRGTFRSRAPTSYGIWT
jgi:putative transposase